MNKDSTGAVRKIASAAARRGTVKAFGEQVGGTIPAGRVADELAAFVCGTWGWGRPAVMRRDGAGANYSSQHSPRQSEVEALAADHPLVGALHHRLSATTAEELEHSEREADTQAASTCRAQGWDICVPIVAEGAIHAWLAFPLQGQVAPTAADLEIIDALAALAGGAVARARTQNELQLAQDAVRRAERLSSLGTLSASVAHEIRNQMVAIQTFLQLLPERLTDPEFLTSFLALANDEVKRISTLVGELLAFARSTDRGVEREDLNHLVERSITILHPEAKKQQVALSHQLEENLPAFFGNGDRINQVLTNLVLNAIQATPAEGTVSITTRALRMGEVTRLQIEVRDTGPGISPEHLSQVFAPFFTTKPEGTGLGLAISRGIVQEHDGEIYVESDPGRGAAFIVDLPAAS